MCNNNFPSLIASLFSWRCLAVFTSSCPHTVTNLRPSSVTISTQASASNAVAFQTPTNPNAYMSLCMQSVHSFSFPSRPLRTAPSRFLGSRPPPLIQMSAPAHKSILARNVVATLSHRVVSRARLYKVIRWSGLLRCAPIMQSKTRWCTVRSLDK